MLRRRPLATTIDALIARGGSSPSNEQEFVRPKETMKRVQLRVPLTVLADIDRLADPKAGRHSWIMFALIEKIARDSNNAQRRLKRRKPLPTIATNEGPL